MQSLQKYRYVQTYNNRVLLIFICYFIVIPFHLFVTKGSNARFSAILPGDL
jgi:hypothetical protein